MIFDIASLNSKELFWDRFSVWLAGFVVAGVAMEAVDEFDTLAEWAGLTTLRGAEYREWIAKLGLLILIAALALEVVTAIKSHEVNQQIVAGLNNEISETQRREKDLIKLTDGLRQQLTDQGSTLDSLGKRSTAFERDANEQKDRDDRALALLRRDEDNLERARHDLNDSAGKASNAADIANKTAAAMTATLDAEKAMRQQMQEIVTPRQIDDLQFAALVTALKKFTGTAIEVAVTREGDSPELMIRITDALSEAKWEIKPWSGGGLPLSSSSRPDLPAFGDVTAHGIQISILESDREKLSPAGLALASGLVISGLRVPQPQAVPEKLANGRPDPFGVKAGIIRLVVGTK